jgi:hypothetical protein
MPEPACRAVALAKAGLSPFDGFDKLPFDRLRVCDTASMLRAGAAGYNWNLVAASASEWTRDGGVASP